MNPYYTAFINFLVDRGSDENALLLATGLSPLQFTEQKLLPNLNTNYHTFWDSGKLLFSFYRTPQGWYYWFQVFSNKSLNELTLEQVLQPYLPKLSNEEILLQFLNHYNLTKPYIHNLEPLNDTSYGVESFTAHSDLRAPSLDLITIATLITKWHTTCDHFKLTGTIDRDKLKELYEHL